MTRIQKDIETSARLVFSVSFDQLQSDWFNFYNTQYNAFEDFNEQQKNSITLKLKSEETITQIIPSNFNNNLILTTNQNSKNRVENFYRPRNTRDSCVVSHSAQRNRRRRIRGLVESERTPLK